jgi:SAM-dependent methyltransferase
MPQNSDYFINHSVTHRWPFTLYHGPIERRIARTIGENSGAIQALNIGCGLFEDFPKVKAHAQWSACDMDVRAVTEVSRRYPELKAFQCQAIPDLPPATFDLIVAKEVIEHVVEAELWLTKVLAAVKPGGRLILSTPNYGISILPLLEYTILEIFARLRGFSRFHIHPMKFSKGRLERLLHKVAGPQARIEVQRESWGMVLFAQIIKA